MLRIVLGLLVVAVGAAMVLGSRALHRRAAALRGPDATSSPFTGPWVLIVIGLIWIAGGVQLIASAG